MFLQICLAIKNIFYRCIEFFDGVTIGMNVTINMLYGENDDIIGEYVTFTKVYNEQCKLRGRTKEAVEETVRICKDKNVLREYLESREKEVIDMMVTLFDEEQIRKAHDKTVRDEGIGIGINRGRENEIFTSVEEGDYSAERGTEKLGISLEVFEERYNTWRKEK